MSRDDIYSKNIIDAKIAADIEACLSQENQLCEYPERELRQTKLPKPRVTIT